MSHAMGLIRAAAIQSSYPEPRVEMFGNKCQCMRKNKSFKSRGTQHGRHVIVFSWTENTKARFRSRSQSKNRYFFLIESKGFQTKEKNKN